jgi:hypothetical protein
MPALLGINACMPISRLRAAAAVCTLPAAGLACSGVVLAADRAQQAHDRCVPMLPSVSRWLRLRSRYLARSRAIYGDWVCNRANRTGYAARPAKVGSKTTCN